MAATRWGTRTTDFLQRRITTMARTKRRIEQTSSEESLWWRSKRQGKYCRVVLCCNFYIHTFIVVVKELQCHRWLVNIWQSYKRQHVVQFFVTRYIFIPINCNQSNDTNTHQRDDLFVKCSRDRQRRFQSALRTRTKPDDSTCVFASTLLTTICGWWPQESYSRQTFVATRRSVCHLLWRRGCLCVCHVDVLCPNDWVDHHATLTNL